MFDSVKYFALFARVLFRFPTKNDINGIENRTELKKNKFPKTSYPNKSGRRVIESS